LLGILALGCAIREPSPEPPISAKQKFAVEFIKSLEDYRSYSYLCPGGRWSIGYGTGSYGWILPYGPNGKTEIPGERNISRVQAEKRMVAYLHANVWNKVPKTLNMAQYAVYASLEYNLGGNKAKVFINKQGSMNCSKILTYRKVKDKKNDGIIKRRKEEYNLCLKTTLQQSY